MRLLMFLVFMLTFACVIQFSGCTELDQARYYGGTATKELPKGEVLMEATWKDSELWVLTKDTTNNTCHFRCYNGSAHNGGEVIFK